MKMQVIIDTLGLTQQDTPESLRNKFRELAKRYHPDVAGDSGNELMKLINEAYHEASDRWDDLKDYLMSGGPQVGNELLGDKLLRVYQALKRVPGIQITLVGSWLWITGDTKPAKEMIKQAANDHGCGVGFSKSKTAWYIKPDKGHRRGRGYSLNEIKTFWGYQNLQKEEKEEDDSLA